MDGISGKDNASATNFIHFYDSASKTNSSWIDLLPNLNNNNDKSDENYPTVKMCTTNSNDDRHELNDINHDSVDDIDDEDDVDDNSTDNLSFLSDDGNHGIIGDIILLTENDIGERVMQSDDDSSDDCVYAYRGAQFEPILAKSEDENDFLEMDFEPDPASEIEQDNLNQQNNQINNIAQASDFKHTNQQACHPTTSSANHITKDYFVTTSKEANNSDQNDDILNIHENGDNIDTKIINKNSTNEFDNKENGILNIDDEQFLTHPSINAELPNITKKYTGTIPKTRNNRLIKTKNSGSSSNSSKNSSNCSEYDSINGRSVNNGFNQWSDRNHLNKRWKIADEIHNTQHLSSNDEQHFSKIRSTDESLSNLNCAKRSMSFSFERIGQRKEKNNEFNRPITSNGSTLYASQSQNHLFSRKHNESNRNGSESEYTTKLTNENVLSAVIYSKDCNEKEICDALAQINIEINKKLLSNNLRKINNLSCDEICKLNVPQYLIYMSKKNSDYKAVIDAIRNSCESKELQIEFIPAETIEPELVRISVEDILIRLPSNGSLNNILTMKNSRFHKFNVLGKIVNVIRKFSDMRYDMIKENYIAIPQYYRSGYIRLSKKLT